MESCVVSKAFRFYAAHRNTDVPGKCESIHGHTYRLAVRVFGKMSGSISIPFEQIEQAVAPLIERLDHSLLLWKDDPAKAALIASGACSKVYELPTQTSCERLAEHIMAELVNAGLNVESVALLETETSGVEVRRCRN